MKLKDIQHETTENAMLFTVIEGMAQGNPE